MVMPGKIGNRIAIDPSAVQLLSHSREQSGIFMHERLGFIDLRPLGVTP